VEEEGAQIKMSKRPLEANQVSRIAQVIFKHKILARKERRKHYKI
jgi:hypothetical protein